MEYFFVRTIFAIIFNFISRNFFCIFLSISFFYSSFHTHFFFRPFSHKSNTNEKKPAGRWRGNCVDLPSLWKNRWWDAYDRLWRLRCLVSLVSGFSLSINHVFPCYLFGLGSQCQQHIPLMLVVGSERFKMKMTFLWCARSVSCSPFCCLSPPREDKFK